MTWQVLDQIEGKGINLSEQINIQQQTIKYQSKAQENEIREKLKCL
jgi:hypothetical protein